MEKRTGQKRKTLQGMTAVIVNYIDDDKVLVKIEETNRQVWTDWKTFSKGLVRGELSNTHVHDEDECLHRKQKALTLIKDFNRTKAYAAAVTLLAIALLIALILK